MNEVPFGADSTLAADKRTLIEALRKAHAHGGLVLGFKNSSTARSARRRMYHVAQSLEAFERQLMNKYELKLKGRMIAITPKTLLSNALQPVVAGSNPASR